MSFAPDEGSNVNKVRTMMPDAIDAKGWPIVTDTYRDSEDRCCHSESPLTEFQTMKPLSQS